MRTLTALLFVTLFLSGCGKKGPLIYPDMLVPAPSTDLAAQQVGNTIRLSFTLPGKDRAGRPLTDLAGVKIFKRDLQAGQDPGCTACTTDFTLFKKWYVDIPDGIQRFGNRLVFLDGAVRNGRSYTYTVTAFTKDDADGAASAQVAATVVQPPSPPVLRAVSQPTEITLEFAGLPLDGTLVGYSIYRTVKGEPFSYVPLVSAPVALNRYTDAGLDRGVTYVYTARSVVRIGGGILVESGLSNEVEGKLKEDE